MSKSPHLVVSISGHGFGHVAQTAPILNLLHEHLPQLQLTVRSSVPLSHLRSRIRAPFEHLQSKGDIGMMMSSALDISIEDTRSAYRSFHENWEKRVFDEAKLLRSLGADAVFSNAALCSLNWADIYRHYCGNDNIAAQILACYTNADTFLRATPGMAMSELPNLVPVAPVAAIGENKRDELNRHLHLSGAEKLVLVSMGGIASRLPIEQWPRMDGVRWLVQDGWQISHPDTIVLDSLPISFSDLLASCDALLCKPGYGSFVEAACSDTPVLYVNRPDWPETPALVEWLQQHVNCREISRKQLESGDFEKDLSSLWAAPPLAPPLPNGATQVVDRLMQWFIP